MLTYDDTVSLAGMGRVNSAVSIWDMRKVQSGVLRADSSDKSSNVVTKSPYGSQASAMSSNPQATEPSKTPSAVPEAEFTSGVPKSNSKPSALFGTSIYGKKKPSDDEIGGA